MSLGLKYVTLEQESLGGCVFQYPRAKLVMTSPVEVPIIGKLKITQTSKEELLEFWRNVEKKTGVAIKYRERVESITPRGGGFLVRTAKGQYAAASVLLAIGRRGTPRKLGVPGEDLSKVVYRLVDPEQYSGQRVLVVGGGDSALEAASSIAESTNAKVALSYRGDAFVRAKVRNRERLESARKTGRLHIVRSLWSRAASSCGFPTKWSSWPRAASCQRIFSRTSACRCRRSTAPHEIALALLVAAGPRGGCVGFCDAGTGQGAAVFEFQDGQASCARKRARG
jgi:hypothetical protein